MHYRYSEYDKANQLSPTENIRREDKRRGFNVRTLGRIVKKVWWVVEFQYLDNDSNIKNYDYSTNAVFANVQW